MTIMRMLIGIAIIQWAFYLAIQFILTDYTSAVKIQPMQRTWILYFDTELNPLKMLNTENIVNSKILCIQIYYGSSLNRLLLNAIKGLLVELQGIHPHLQWTIPEILCTSITATPSPFMQTTKQTNKQKHTNKQKIQINH